MVVGTTGAHRGTAAHRRLHFYKGKGSIKSRVFYRVFYAVSAAVIARGDNGRWEPNYSRVLGHFSAAAISNLYNPEADRGASLVLFNGLAGIGENAVSNLIREFVLKRFTSHVPKGANGQPSHDLKKRREFVPKTDHEIEIQGAERGFEA